jgi:hypothetical protein
LNLRGQVATPNRGTNGRRIINKEHRGVAIYLRLGPISQEDAEQQLRSEVDRIDAELRYNANHRHRFVDCAERYLAESKHRRSVDVAAWHIRLLTPYIGMLEIHQIHDATLKSFVSDRLASGVKPSTVNRSLEVVRTILHRAARSPEIHICESYDLARNLRPLIDFEHRAQSMEAVSHDHPARFFVTNE